MVDAVSKTWTMEVGELGRRWSNGPYDLIAPSLPVISVTGQSASSVSLQVTTPSVDERSGILRYIVERSISPFGPWTEELTLSPSAATAGFSVLGLNADTTYYFRTFAEDASQAHNRSEASAIVSATTLTAGGGGADVDRWFPNWPVMLISVNPGSASSGLLDSSQHSTLKDLDVMVFGGYFPTTSTIAERIAAFDAIRALRTQPAGAAQYQKRPRFLQRMNVNHTYKNALVPAGTDPLEVTRALIVDPTRGNENWFAHVAGDTSATGRVESVANPTSLFNCNLAALVAGNNSLGENFAFAFWKEWKPLLDGTTFGAQYNISVYYSGMYIDGFNGKPPDMYQNNGTTLVTTQDYNANGVADGRVDYSAGANAGGRFWTQGLKEFATQLKPRFGSWYVPFAGTTRVAFDYFDGSNQSPPLPLSSHPYYRYFSMYLGIGNCLSLLGITKGTSVYNYTPVSIDQFYRRCRIAGEMRVPDASNTETGGRSCMGIEYQVIDRTPTQDDYNMARFIFALCMLEEGWAPSSKFNDSRFFPLDEYLLQFGNPVGTRSMGSLDGTTLAFTRRAANATVGTAEFYWQEYANALVVVRLDSPPSGTLPGGVAVAVTLPSAGAAKKWQRINSASYTNPVTGLTMRNQSPIVNNGQDATSVSLRPWEAIVLRRVDGPTSAWAESTTSYLPIVPGAAGWAMETTAASGRHSISGGLAAPVTVYGITNLSTGNGPGSARAAFEASGDRIIIPWVSGVVNFTTAGDDNRDITFGPGRIIYAGQCAPSPGLVFYGAQFIISAANNKNSLLWHLTAFQFPYVDKVKQDSRGDVINFHTEPGEAGQTNSNIAVANSWFAWGNDELAGINYGVHHLSFWQCVFAEALANSDTLEGVPHPYGPLVQHERNDVVIDFIRCVFMHNQARNPFQCGQLASILNCLFFDCWERAISLGSMDNVRTDTNIEGCIILTGPEPSSNTELVHRQTGGGALLAASSSFYMNGNRGIGFNDSTQTALTNSSGPGVMAGSRIAAAYPAGYNVTNISNEEDFTRLVARYAGSRPLNRFSHQTRPMGHIEARLTGSGSQGGRVLLPSSVGGMPALAQNSVDHTQGADPIPGVTSSATQTLGTAGRTIQASGYTALEEWLHRKHNALMPSS